MIRNSFFSLIGFILVTQCNVASAINLVQAVEAAINNDPEFRMALKENESGQASRVIGRSAILPQVTASLYQASNDTKIAGPVFLNGPNNISNRAYPSTNTVVQLSQPLFNLEALARYRLGYAQADLSDVRFMHRSQEVLIRVLQNYIDVLYAQDQLTSISAERDANKERLIVIKRMFQNGEATILNKLEAQAIFERLEVQVIEANDNLEIAKRKLADLIGEPILSAGNLHKLTTHFTVNLLVPNSFELWKETALANSLEIRYQLKSIEVNRQDYQRNRAGHYPVLSAVASWNQQKSNTVSTISQDINNSAIGIQLNIPIFSGGDITGKISQSRAILEKSEAELDLIKNKVLVELRKQFDLVTSSQQKISALKKAVSYTSELAKAMRKGISLGQQIKLDVLNADKDLAIAQRELSQAQYTYLLAFSRLRQIAGVLSIEDLEKIALSFNVTK